MSAKPIREYDAKVRCATAASSFRAQATVQYRGTLEALLGPQLTRSQLLLSHWLERSPAFSKQTQASSGYKGPQPKVAQVRSSISPSDEG